MASNSSENVYNVDYSKPGLVLIINNQNFVQTEERKGSDKDVDRIMDTFENLNFKTRSFMNQTKQQMKDLVENYSKRDYSNDSCFVCFIMSHGDNGKILCSDEMQIDLKKEIIKPFQINQTLVNKPKLFFIQACRGDNVMPNIERLNISHDLIRQTSNIETDAIKLPMHADLLYSYATVEGYVALRDRNRGSWYVQILCDVISDKAANEEFSHLLLEVNNRMAEKEIVISSFECQLRKKLYLARNKNISRIIKKVYGNGRYEGEMKDDKRNGQGIYYYNSGNRYEGNWKDDKRNGQGIYYFNDGDRYEGNWKDGNKNGQGIHYFKNGTQISQVWLNGNKIN
jgi:caspase 3